MPQMQHASRKRVAALLLFLASRYVPLVDGDRPARRNRLLLGHVGHASGSPVASERTFWVELTYDSFEKGWGVWEATESDGAYGGGASRHNDTGKASNGDYSIHLTNHITSTSEIRSKRNIGIAAYDKLRITFSFYVDSMDIGDSFLLEFSSDEGSSWDAIKSWKGCEKPATHGNTSVSPIRDKTRYLDQQVIIDSRNYPNLQFTQSSRLRFRMDAEKASASVYLDAVQIDVASSRLMIARTLQGDYSKTDLVSSVKVGQDDFDEGPIFGGVRAVRAMHGNEVNGIQLVYRDTTVGNGGEGGFFGYDINEIDFEQSLADDEEIVKIEAMEHQGNYCMEYIKFTTDQDNVIDVDSKDINNGGGTVKTFEAPTGYILGGIHGLTGGTYRNGTGLISVGFYWVERDSTQSFSLQLEAEDYTSKYKSVFKDDREGHSGTGFMRLRINGFIVWDNIEVPDYGVYELIIRYAVGDTNGRSCKLLVGGSDIADLPFDYTEPNGWNSWGVESMLISLDQGLNTVRIETLTDNRGPAIDYIKIISQTLDTVVGPSQAPSQEASSSPSLSLSIPPSAPPIISELPSTTASNEPSPNPSARTSQVPSVTASPNPSARTSQVPSVMASGTPSGSPSSSPSSASPTGKPSLAASPNPSARTSQVPSVMASGTPSGSPSSSPSSASSTGKPSLAESGSPSTSPTKAPLEIISVPTSTYEAEDYTSKSSGVSIESDRGDQPYSSGGFSGVGYMDFAGSGSYIEWDNINVPIAGSYELNIRYAVGDSNGRRSDLIVNGYTIVEMPFAYTDWDFFKYASAVEVDLDSGDNTVRIESIGDGPNIDLMDVVFVQPPAPTISPAPTSDREVTYRPGDFDNGLTMVDLKLSAGLKAEIVAEKDERVVYDDGSTSSMNFHSAADGAAVIEDPDGSGLYAYVSNSERSGGDGGCGSIIFYSDGRVKEYKWLLGGTTRNCSGGKTPWNTWLSCEEDTDGRIWEVDPFGVERWDGQTYQLTSMHRKSDGNSRPDWFESVACDNSNPAAPIFFITIDQGDGELRRFKPDQNVTASAMASGDYMDVLSHDNVGTVDYLILNEDGTFEWTNTRDDGQESASARFRNCEGIEFDEKSQILYFVSKNLNLLFALDMSNTESGTWQSFPTTQGFGGEPDQIKLICLEDDQGMLYFAEDGGDCGIYARTPEGDFLEIIATTLNSNDMCPQRETTGVAISPDHMFLFFATQGWSRIYKVWRDDGYPFSGEWLTESSQFKFAALAKAQAQALKGGTPQTTLAMHKLTYGEGYTLTPDSGASGLRRTGGSGQSYSTDEHERERERKHPNHYEYME